MAAPAFDFLQRAAPPGGVPGASLPGPAAAPGRSPASQPRAPVPLRQVIEQARGAFPAANVPQPAAAPAADPAAMTVEQLVALVSDPGVDWRTKAPAFDEIERRKTRATYGADAGPAAAPPVDAILADSGPAIPAADARGNELAALPTAPTGVAGRARMAGVTPELVAAVIAAESGGNPNAVNPATGAAGLMQIMPRTAADPGYGVRPMDWERRFDPEENKRFGAEYLNALMGEFGGDPEAALVAYNWGPGNAKKWLREGANPDALPAETRAYVGKILPVLRSEIWGSDGADTVAGTGAGDDLASPIASGTGEVAPATGEASRFVHRPNFGPGGGWPRDIADALTEGPGGPRGGSVEFPNPPAGYGEATRPAVPAPQPQVAAAPAPEPAGGNLALAELAKQAQILLSPPSASARVAARDQTPPGPPPPPGAPTPGSLQALMREATGLDLWGRGGMNEQYGVDPRLAELTVARAPFETGRGLPPVPIDAGAAPVAPVAQPSVSPEIAARIASATTPGGSPLFANPPTGPGTRGPITAPQIAPQGGAAPPNPSLAELAARAQQLDVMPAVAALERAALSRPPYETMRGGPAVPFTEGLQSEMAQFVPSASERVAARPMVAGPDRGLRPDVPGGAPLAGAPGARPMAPEAGVVTPSPVGPDGRLAAAVTRGPDAGAAAGPARTPLTGRAAPPDRRAAAIREALPPQAQQQVAQAATAAAAATSATPEEAEQKSNLWEALLLFGLATLASAGQQGQTNLGAIAAGGLTALDLLNQRRDQQAAREEKASQPPQMETLYDDDGNPYTAQWDKGSRSWVKIAGGKRNAVEARSDIGKLAQDLQSGLISPADYTAEVKRLRAEEGEGPQTMLAKANADLAAGRLTPAQHAAIVAKETREDPLTQSLIDDREARRRQSEQDRLIRIEEKAAAYETSLTNAMLRNSFTGSLSAEQEQAVASQVGAYRQRLEKAAGVESLPEPPPIAVPAAGALPPGVTAEQAYEGARAALAAGKDPVAVKARLQQWGLDPARL